MRKINSRLLILAGLGFLFSMPEISVAQDYYAYHYSQGSIAPAQGQSRSSATKKRAVQKVEVVNTVEALPAIPAQGLKTIVIDPGHGGENEGAIGIAGVHEKHLTLELSLVLAERLKTQYPEAQILLTRTSDEFVSLADRAAFANEHKADVFLSIHFNSSANPEAYGFESFWVGEFWKSEPDVVDPQEHALRIDAAQRSQWLGECFNLAMGKHFDTMDRGVKPGDYTVLTRAKVPAVVLEFAFLSHAQEGVKILDNNYRDQMISALLDTLVNYSKGRTADERLP